PRAAAAVVEHEAVRSGGEQPVRGGGERADVRKIRDHGALIRPPRAALVGPSDSRTVGLVSEDCEKAQSDRPTVRQSDCHAVSGGSSTVSTGGPCGLASLQARQMSGNAAST